MTTEQATLLRQATGNTSWTLQRRRCVWIVDNIILEENRRFTWKKIVAHWSGFGYAPFEPPLWPKEPRTFLMDRRRK